MESENLTAILYKTDDLRVEHRPVPEVGQGQVCTVLYLLENDDCIQYSRLINVRYMYPTGGQSVQ